MTPHPRSPAGAPPRADAAPPPSRDGIGTALGLVAAACLVAYPALRPASDEQSLAAAAAWSSPAWTWSHLLGMVGFVLVTVVLRRWGHRRPALVMGASTALVLPYYGMETFALAGLGRRAIATGDVSWVEQGDALRYDPVPMVLFAAGLLGFAAVGILLARTLWRTQPAAAVLLFLGLVGYLPQFFLPAPLRIVHGAVLALGVALMLRRGRRS